MSEAQKNILLIAVAVIIYTIDIFLLTRYAERKRTSVLIEKVKDLMDEFEGIRKELERENEMLKDRVSSLLRVIASLENQLEQERGELISPATESEVDTDDRD